ncbi:MAG: glycosyltransferase family 52 [Providencia rettgeri]
MNKNVFICKTTWEHFITLLICANLYNKSKKKSIIIIEQAIENDSFFEKIEKLDYFNECIRISLIQNKMIKFLLFKYRIFYSLKKKLKKLISSTNSINVFVDQSVLSQVFIHSGIQLNLYEHGNGNYLVGAYPNFRILKKILGVSPGYGRSKAIKNIFLQYPDKAPEDIKDKVKKLDLQYLFNSLKEEQKKEIFNIFNIPEINPLDNTVLILTQPLSEDRFMSERKKIEIYKNIITNYKNRKIYIKPHPRDMTNYSSIFKSDNITIFPSTFPIEILNFKNIKFDTAATVCSGSIYNFHYPINVDILGTEEFPELIAPLGVVKKQSIPKEKYTSIEYI